MSYSHTKRRKTIKKLKKQSEDWLNILQDIGYDVRIKNQGKCLGSIEQILAGYPEPLLQ